MSKVRPEALHSFRLVISDDHQELGLVNVALIMQYRHHTFERGGLVLVVRLETLPSSRRFSWSASNRPTH
jgi:hypothetical protein